MIDISIETYIGDQMEESVDKETSKGICREAAKDSLLRLYSAENKKLRKIIIAQAVKIFELGGYESQSDTGGYE